MIFEVVVFVLLAVVRIDTQSDCTGLPDGPCCAGCHSYTNCTDGVGQTVDCNPPDEAYNYIIGGCDKFENTPPPCGNNDNCTGLPDGKYADMTPGKECEAFFTCSRGVNRGVTLCNPQIQQMNLSFTRNYNSATGEVRFQLHVGPMECPRFHDSESVFQSCPTQLFNE